MKNIERQIRKAMDVYFKYRISLSHHNMGIMSNNTFGIKNYKIALKEKVKKGFAVIKTYKLHDESFIQFKDVADYLIIDVWEHNIFKNL